MARSYLGSGIGIAVNAAGMVSAFGVQLACLNAAARLLFALGRETGAAVLGYVLYRTFAPFPAAPFSWIVLAASASVILGVATLLVPGLLTRMRGSQVLAVTATAVTGPAARPR